jgi:hypothetical protein
MYSIQQLSTHHSYYSNFLARLQQAVNTKRAQVIRILKKQDFSST